MPKIEMGGKYKTKSGHPVTLFTTTARGDYPVKGLVHYESEDSEEGWTEEGYFFNDDDYGGGSLDLVEDREPMEIECWVDENGSIGRIEGSNFSLSSPCELPVRKVTFREVMEDEQ